MARETGGQMIFIQADMANDNEVEYGVIEAAKLGKIKYLANITNIQPIFAAKRNPMKAYGRVRETLLRAPFYLSQLTIAHMKKNDTSTGVIAIMASNDSPFCKNNQIIDKISKYSFRALSQAIAIEGEGKVRSFTVNIGAGTSCLAAAPVLTQIEKQEQREEKVIQALKTETPNTKENMTSIEAANLLIFGFSRFARYFVGGDLLCEDSNALA
jgi:3-hydroxybutyrate dehydrogenase